MQTELLSQLQRTIKEGSDKINQVTETLQAGRYGSPEELKTLRNEARRLHYAQAVMKKAHARLQELENLITHLGRGPANWCHVPDRAGDDLKGLVPSEHVK